MCASKIASTPMPQVNRRGMASAALPILCMAALIQPAHLENLEVGKRGDALYFKAKGNVNDGKMTMDATMEIGTPKALTEFAGDSEMRFTADLVSEVDACAPADATLSMSGDLTIKVNPNNCCQLGLGYSNTIDCMYGAMAKLHEDWAAKMKRDLCEAGGTKEDYCCMGLKIPLVNKKLKGNNIKFSDVVDPMTQSILEYLGTDLTFWVQDEKAESGGVTFTIEAQMHVLDARKMEDGSLLKSTLGADFAVIRTKRENIGEFFKDLHDNAGIGGTTGFIDESGRITIPHTCAAARSVSGAVSDPEKWFDGLMAKAAAAEAEDEGGGGAGVAIAVILVLLILGIVGGCGFWFFKERKKNPDLTAAEFQGIVKNKGDELRANVSARAQAVQANIAARKDGAAEKKEEDIEGQQQKSQADAAIAEKPANEAKAAKEEHKAEGAAQKAAQM